jgi:hypothetical protein
MALAVKGFNKMKKIQSPKKMKVSKVAKYKKIEVPVVKAAEKELTKAEKRLKKIETKKKLSDLVKESNKDGK